MWKPLTCDGFGNVTFSQESEAGPMPPDLLESPTPCRYGPEAAPASRSAQPQAEKVAACHQKSTSGPSGFASSELAVLLPSLGSRFPLPVLGLMRSLMDWRQRAIPSGRLISRLARLGQTTYGTGSGYLATPTATANQDAPSMQKHKGCRGVVVSPAEWCRRMGYPPEWLAAAPFYGDSETPSSRRSPQRSSAPMPSP